MDTTAELARLEKEILDRHRAIEEKATRTIDAAVHLMSGGDGRDDGRGRTLLEDSLREILEKAEREEEKTETDDKEDDCEVKEQPDATVRLQSVKIKDLESRLDIAMDTIKEKDKELKMKETACSELKTSIEKEKEKHKRQLAEIERLREDATSARNRIDGLKDELRASNGRIAEHEKERKHLSSMAKTKDLKQKRIAEELERCKSTMESLKLHDRTSKEDAKRDRNNLLEENKKLEKQKAELVIALRKQMKLIDVLKKQKAHMEAAKLLSFTEEEFESVLSGDQ